MHQRTFRQIALLLALSISAQAQDRGSARAPDSAFASLAREVVFTSVAFSPAAATQTGLHAWTEPRSGRHVLLDSLLDDLSPAAIRFQRQYYRRVRRRLAAIPRARLDAQTRADYDALRDAADFALFSLDEERLVNRRPQLYAELAGSALFANMSLEYAPKVDRAAHLTARVEQLPAFLTTARGNLTATNSIYTKVAAEETDGVANLITGPGTEFVKGTPSSTRYLGAAARAVAALRAYQVFIRDTLPRRGTYDWRAGPTLYAGKWRYFMHVSRSPAELLALARDSVRTARRQMLAIASPLHEQWFPGHRHDGDADAQLNAIVGEVLTRIGAEHAHRDSLLEAMSDNIHRLERRVRERRVLSLDSVPGLQIIPTPEFQRGIYGVAGAAFAPALEPSLASFFWVTPIPPDWSAERAEAKLREYNTYKALDLSIHEGVPGHVVQGDYANRITPEWRRLLRAIVAGNTPYVEGWAVYAEHVMMYDAGVDGGDATKMRLTDLKGMLRIYTNAIVDIGLHTEGWPTDSAVAMMMRDAFQERPEAEAKLQRAQLDYVQLVSYLAGVTDWTSFRREAQRREGSAFNLCRFHDTVLLYGALPIPVVRRLYFDRVPPSASIPAAWCGSAAPPM
ncbi:MAG TPA: DUF885 domain-containing protein [Gemmatimonadaceae bacterium]